MTPNPITITRVKQEEDKFSKICIQGNQLNASSLRIKYGSLNEAVDFVGELLKQAKAEDARLGDLIIIDMDGVAEIDQSGHNFLRRINSNAKEMGLKIAVHNAEQNVAKLLGTNKKNLGIEFIAKEKPSPEVCPDHISKPKPPREREN